MNNSPANDTDASMLEEHAERPVPTIDLSKKSLNCVVVGSVDHGKSTLIGRLLYDTGSLAETQLEAVRKACGSESAEIEFAFLLDHLEEERTGRITIDTSQIFFSFNGREYGIIDAPGHREFLRNMITGASRASAAILVLDAQEGICEQTRRHSHMLRLLGIEQVIVAVNKMDTAAFDRVIFENMASQIKRLLRSLGLEHLAIVPVSALQGDNIVKPSLNMIWYEGPILIQTLEILSFPTDSSDQPLRLPVQDRYEIDSRGILVGRIVSGTLCRSDKVVVNPRGIETRVKTLDTMEGQIGVATAGMSIGFTLEDNHKIKRGDILTAPYFLPENTRSICVIVFWMDKEALTVGESILLRLATQEVVCEVVAIRNRTDSGTLQVIDENTTRLLNTEVGSVEFRSDTPLVYDSFASIPEMGRLVIIRSGDIVGGGIVEQGYC